MPRIAGTDLPEGRPVHFALTAIYGIGRNNVQSLLKKAKVEPAKRVRELTEEEIARIQKVIEADYMVEGDLRRLIADNIKRLQTIGSYRGKRHAQGLPVRGQRTKTNARTKRGKRKTVGALKKEERAKVEAPQQ
ncbi:MAG: 30S ribosomal protein S13 [Microgenomates group bacterium GW2011_GWC1_41_8]|uniref:Small ribosomal subunit protein uS13 n=3 Tax=Candidatus Roizmaniibacteriota TaxID=1752723 RepID=A0A0G0XE67_9BACT|nr:MAG: 30S ribosomal protein S13 [Candidatus Roizmanbacteria bacterium GW2011_GWB1_40_7]KKR94576.1 MAG: 30S ribosomal protein S13 [Candidatus Roizmanbacteria bacterium GW2011_GWA1_41_13]KKS23164.1 MAG: 30S ribosomal protein S13 [Candidatus Roizmanbacteria bacterium GW2011_GWC2_41_7]KKS24264.1 MAG: 30S ribosomal protein S13 [Microgenomates group bacterium GW2011_GWC1_41_8]OGK48405.1 MAG: 30S ribosomal protein S13 [Candidatus Roizmanbacteria bacterium RIFCSPLOWO2_01_FULL_40_14]